MKIFLFLSILFILLMSCSSQPSEDVNAPNELQHVTPTLILDPPKGWNKRWLEKMPCEAPCWENIIPGKTSAVEVERILGEISYVSSIQNYPRLTGGYGAIEFIVGKEQLGIVFYNPEEPKEVWKISPPIGLVKLSEVMDAYGEPSHVVAIASAPADIYAPVVYSLNVIYLNKGILLRDNNHPDQKTDLQTDPLFSVSFFPPTREGLEAITSLKHMRNWEGIKTFDYYCMDDQDGLNCKGSR